MSLITSLRSKRAVLVSEATILSHRPPVGGHRRERDSSALQRTTLKLPLTIFFSTLLWGVGVLCGMVALAAFPLPAAAQEAPLSAEEQKKAERSAIEVWDTVMSPYCPGRTLSGCPSDKARALRDEILVWFSQGDSKSEVIAKLSEKYGDQIRGEPELAGVGAVGWFAPAVFLLLGAALIVFITKQKRGIVAPQGEELSAVEDVLRAKLAGESEKKTSVETN